MAKIMIKLPVKIRRGKRKTKKNVLRNNMPYSTHHPAHLCVTLSANRVVEDLHCFKEQSTPELVTSKPMHDDAAPQLCDTQLLYTATPQVTEDSVPSALCEPSNRTVSIHSEQGVLSPEEDTNALNAAVLSSVEPAESFSCTLPRVGVLSKVEKALTSFHADPKLVTQSPLLLDNHGMPNTATDDVRQESLSDLPEVPENDDTDSAQNLRVDPLFEPCSSSSATDYCSSTSSPLCLSKDGAAETSSEDCEDHECQQTNVPNNVVTVEIETPLCIDDIAVIANEPALHQPPHIESSFVADKEQQHEKQEPSAEDKTQRCSKITPSDSDSIAEMFRAKRESIGNTFFNALHLTFSAVAEYIETHTVMCDAVGSEAVPLQAVGQNSVVGDHPRVPPSEINSFEESFGSVVDDKEEPGVGLTKVCCCGCHDSMVPLATPSQSLHHQPHYHVLKGLLIEWIKIACRLNEQVIHLKAKMESERKWFQQNLSVKDQHINHLSETAHSVIGELTMSTEAFRTLDAKLKTLAVRHPGKKLKRSRTQDVVSTKTPLHPRAHTTSANAGIPQNSSLLSQRPLTTDSEGFKDFEWSQAVTGKAKMGAALTDPTGRVNEKQRLLLTTSKEKRVLSEEKVSLLEEKTLRLDNDGLPVSLDVAHCPTVSRGYSREPAFVSKHPPHLNCTGRSVDHLDATPSGISKFSSDVLGKRQVQKEVKSLMATLNVCCQTKHDKECSGRSSLLAEDCLVDTYLARQCNPTVIQCTQSSDTSGSDASGETESKSMSVVRRCGAAQEKYKGIWEKHSEPVKKKHMRFSPNAYFEQSVMPSTANSLMHWSLPPLQRANTGNDEPLLLSDKTTYQNPGCRWVPPLFYNSDSEQSSTTPCTSYRDKADVKLRCFRLKDYITRSTMVYREGAQHLSAFLASRYAATELHITPRRFTLPNASVSVHHCLLIATDMTIHHCASQLKRLATATRRSVLAALHPVDPRLVVDTKAWVWLATERILQNKRRGAWEAAWDYPTAILDDAVYVTMCSPTMSLSQADYHDFEACLSTHDVSAPQRCSLDKHSELFHPLNVFPGRNAQAFPRPTKDVMVRVIEYFALSTRPHRTTTVLLCCGVGHWASQKRPESRVQSKLSVSQRVTERAEDPGNVWDYALERLLESTSSDADDSNKRNINVDAWIDDVYLLPSDYIVATDATTLMLRGVPLRPFLFLTDVMQENAELNILVDTGGAGTELYSALASAATKLQRPETLAHHRISALDHTSLLASRQSPQGGTVSIKLCRTAELARSSPAFSNSMFFERSTSRYDVQLKNIRGYREQDVNETLRHLHDLIPELTIYMDFD